MEKYVRYSSRKNGSIVLEKGAPKNLVWVLLDQDNGNPELGFGYLWLFETKEEAQEKLKGYLICSDTISALIGPFHMSHISRDFLCMARFDFEPKIYRSYLRYRAHVVAKPESQQEAK